MCELLLLFRVAAKKNQRNSNGRAAIAIEKNSMLNAICKAFNLSSSCSSVRCLGRIFFSHYIDATKNLYERVFLTCLREFSRENFGGHAYCLWIIIRHGDKLLPDAQLDASQEITHCVEKFVEYWFTLIMLNACTSLLAASKFNWRCSSFGMLSFSYFILNKIIY